MFFGLRNQEAHFTSILLGLCHLLSNAALYLPYLQSLTRTYQVRCQAVPCLQLLHRHAELGGYPTQRVALLNLIIGHAIDCICSINRSFLQKINLNYGNC